MAQEIDVFRKCTQCDGTGEFTPPGKNQSPIPCNWPDCIGPPGPDGYLKGDSFTLDPGLDYVIDKCNDILNKCNDIIEKLNE